MSKYETHECEFEEIIFVRLNEGEDLLKAIWNIAKENDIRAGVILEGTGALSNVVFQGIPKKKYACALPLDVYELGGILQTNVRGLIGITAKGDADWTDSSIKKVPHVIENEEDFWNYHGSEGGVDTPCFQGHFAVVNKDVSVMGRVLPGTKIENAGMGKTDNLPTHFSLVIGKVKGVEYRMKLNKDQFVQEIVKL